MLRRGRSTERAVAPLGAVALLLSVACGPVDPGLMTADDAELEHVGRPERVAYYGGPGPTYSRSAREDALWRSAVGTNPSCRCAQDERLDVTARAHAIDLAASTKPPADTDLDHLRFSLLMQGGTDYVLQPLMTTLDEQGRAALRSFVLAHGDRWTHCGVGIDGPPGREVVVWIGVERVVELGPLPVRSPAGVELEIEGRTLDARPIAVQPFLGLPDGSVKRLAIASDWSGIGGGRFRVTIPLAAAGRHDFELLVDSGRGPETAVLLPLYVDQPPEYGPVITLEAPANAGDRPATDNLAALLGKTRKRAGLGRLERDPRLDRIAGQHCRQMVELGFFGHRSPDGGLLGDRLRAAGLTPAKSAENIARSRSVTRVHHNLMESPSHRLNIVDSEFTHFGLGVTRDGDDVVVTEIFARW
jgi:hypothetical protein